MISSGVIWRRILFSYGGGEYYLDGGECDNAVMGVGVVIMMLWEWGVLLRCDAEGRISYIVLLSGDVAARGGRGGMLLCNGVLIGWY